MKRRDSGAKCQRANGRPECDDRSMKAPTPTFGTFITWELKRALPMKKLLILLVILFIYVFLKSNTIEQEQWKEQKDGVEYLRNSYQLNWNNFSSYLQRAYKSAKGLIPKPR
jgi:hypothetical protein